MGWNRYVLGYHGCELRLAKALASGEVRDLLPSENAYDWLGQGVYFWENDPARAVRWAADAKRLKEPAVVGAIIDLGSCLDLVDIESIEVVRDAWIKLSDTFAVAGKSVPKNTNSGARYLDCAVFGMLHELRGERGLPPFDTIRAYFSEGTPVYEGSALRALDHLQVCVRDVRRIIGYFPPR